MVVLLSSSSSCGSGDLESKAYGDVKMPLQSCVAFLGRVDGKSII